MFTQDEFDLWCRRLNLSEEARKVIEQIRSSEPSRLVGGGIKNVAGRFPSRKMGVTIQFESHKVELPFIYQLEYDDNVLEFYDQPPPIKMTYESNDGKNVGFFYTPDFFVIKANSAGWVECKTENKLQQLAEKNSNRYLLDAHSQWRTPPGERYAEQFGFFFQLWSNAEINWNLQRNLVFLEDYYYAKNLVVEESVTKTVLSVLSAQPAITLAALLDFAEGTTSDDIYSLIATDQIYVDLNAAPLVEPERCFVFRDQQTAFAYRSLVLAQTKSDAISFPIVDIVPGSSVIYDSNILTIICVGDTSVLLNTKDGQAVEFTLATFQSLIREGKITGFKNKVKCNFSNEVKEILLKASEKDLKDANHRYSMIEPLLKGQPIEDTTIPKRSLRYWKAKYLQAQQKYGYGYLGLLSFDNLKGNRNSKLPKQTIQIIQKFIEEDYETHKQKSKSAVYSAFTTFLSSEGVSDELIPSYKTFIKEIRKNSGYEQTVKRSGPRAAYSQEPFYWELELTTPRHGDRPFEIGHIDHTQIDLDLKCSRTAKALGRAWVTFLVDAYTRRILAIYITFDPPSYRSCMMVLRICVQRHGRLPQVIVNDNGTEFHSTYYQTLIAICELTVKYRPKSKARFNSIGERLFGTAMTQLVYNLAGNTQITKKVRLMTKSVNPKNLALWTLDLFYYYLCEWAYEVYDTMEHPALGQTPREAFAGGIAQFGSRPHRMISYGEDFKLLTMPTTDKKKVKVDPSQGIQINYIHYWSNAFRDSEIQKTYVDVRYDPFNAGIAYAYIGGQWVECISQQYPIFKGRSEKEIEIATTELRKRNQNHAKQFKVRAKHLASFLSTVEAEEILLEQRLRDAQVKDVFCVIEGHLPNRVPYTQSQENDSEDTKQSKDWEHATNQAININVNKFQIYQEY